MRIKKHVLGVAIILFIFGMHDVVAAQHFVIAAAEKVDMDIPLKLLTEAYKRIGITIEIRRYPLERAIQMANSGGVDGDILRQEGIEHDYPNLLRVPVPIKTDEIVVVTKNKRFKVDGWNSLIPYKVGYLLGVKGVEMNLVEGTYTEAVATAEQAYRKLAAGRTDVIVDARTQAQLILKELGLNDLVLLEPPLAAIDMFHYLHVKNRKVLQPLTKALQQMEREGMIQRIAEQAETAVPAPSE